MDAIDSSVELVNHAISLLAREAADASSFARVSKIQLQLRQALQTFSQVGNGAPRLPGCRPAGKGEG
jgi:hypothetical protein